MAETSSAAFDCAAKNWNGGSQQTATSSSSLTELLTEIKSTNKQQSSSLSTKPNAPFIKNGNVVVDEPFVLSDHLIKKKSSQATSFHKLIDSNANFCPINENNNSNNNQPDDRTRTDNQKEFQKESKHEVNKSKEITTSHPQRDDNILFRVGFKLEACDSNPAKVVGVNEEDRQVLIHFIRWSKKFDEWMSMSSDQLRALTKEDEYSEAESQSFTVGKLVLASWSDNKKYPGQVLSVTTDGNYNILFLDGYRKKVKKSLVEQIPDDYQINFNFNSPLINNSTQSADGGKTMLTNNSNTVETSNQIHHQTTNGSTSTNILSSSVAPLLTSTSTNSKSKKRITDHLVASKEFVITEDHNPFKCEAENCNKSFRKEKLLISHIKYYHPDIYHSDECKKRRLEQERESSSHLDDSLSNDVSSINSSRRTAINDNSNTSWNSEVITPKPKSSSKKNIKELTDKQTASTSSSTKSKQLINNDDSAIADQQPSLQTNLQFVNGEFGSLDLKSDQRVKFEVSENVGNINRVLPFKASMEVTPVSYMMNNGRISCKWEIRYDATINNKHYNFYNDYYYLLLAKGNLEANSDTKEYHDVKSASDTMVQLRSVGIIQSKLSIKTLVKLHGSFMVIAWIYLSSIAIMVARYYKECWDEKTLMGVKIWFFVHRGLNTLTLFAGITATIAIFINVGRWRVNSYHQYFGVATNVFMIFQPINAMFRCGPQDKSRWIFNLVHWLGGNIAHACGIIAILFASTLSAVNLPNYFNIIVFSFIIFHVLIHTILQSYTYHIQKKVQKEEIPMRDINLPRSGIVKDTNGESVKMFFLTLYILVLTAITIALLIIICRNS